MKHIKVDYHFIREKIFNKDLLARYISTHAQPSDIFTKGLSKARFLLLRGKLMVASLPINLRGNVKEMISENQVHADTEEEQITAHAA